MMKEDDGDWKEITAVKSYDNEYKIPNLKPEKKYDFAVVAENKAGRGDAMETMTPTVLKEKPKKPGIHFAIFVLEYSRASGLYPFNPLKTADP